MQKFPVGRCSDSECSIMNSCKTSGMAGLTTAVLCKNLSLDLFSWFGVCPGRETKWWEKTGGIDKAPSVILLERCQGLPCGECVGSHCVSLLLDG